VTETIAGKPSAWKCPACAEPFDLLRYRGNEKEKFVAMYAAYNKHFRYRHQYDS